MPVPGVAKTQVSATRAWRNDNGHREIFSAVEARLPEIAARAFMARSHRQLYF
jgi:hypothetical protein